MAIENRFATENLVQNALDDLTSCVAFIDTENNEIVTDVEISGGDITVDSVLSTSSVNPVQNKVVTSAINQLSEQKVDKQGITLDKDTDGLIYIFVDGVKVGNGVEVNGEIIEGDVTGILDENNNLLLSGALADGTYTLKWLLDDGTYSDAGTMVVSTVVKPSYTNLAEPNTDNKTDWSIWINDARFGNGDGTYRENIGTIVSNYIPYDTSNGAPMLRSKGINVAQWAFYSAEKAYRSYGNIANTNTLLGHVKVDGDYAECSTPYRDVGYVRIQGTLSGSIDDVIITVDEEIV